MMTCRRDLFDFLAVLKLVFIVESAAAAWRPLEQLSVPSCLSGMPVCVYVRWPSEPANGTFCVIDSRIDDRWYAMARRVLIVPTRYE